MTTKNSSKEPKASSKLVAFINGCVRSQTHQILIGKRKKYNQFGVCAMASKIFEKYDKIKFGYSCKYYFKKERSRYTSKFSRVQSNKFINQLSKEYPLVDVFRIAKLLVFEEKIDTRKKKDLGMLEYIIRANLGMSMFAFEKDFSHKSNDELEVLEYIKQKEDAEQLRKIILANLKKRSREEGLLNE